MYLIYTYTMNKYIHYIHTQYPQSTLKSTYTKYPKKHCSVAHLSDLADKITFNINQIIKTQEAHCSEAMLDALWLYRAIYVSTGQQEARFAWTTVHRYKPLEMITWMTCYASGLQKRWHYVTTVPTGSRICQDKARQKRSSKWPAQSRKLGNNNSPTIQWHALWQFHGRNGSSTLSQRTSFDLRTKLAHVVRDSILVQVTCKVSQRNSVLVQLAHLIREV